jgi:hypothetical protein
MSSITIVLVGLPRMLRDLVASAVESQPDLEIVGDADRADVVVAGAASLDEAKALDLVARNGLRVLSVGDDGEATLYECRPMRTPVGELTPDLLVRLLRTDRA